MLVIGLLATLVAVAALTVAYYAGRWAVPPDEDEPERNFPLWAAVVVAAGMLALVALLAVLSDDPAEDCQGYYDYENLTCYEEP